MTTQYAAVRLKEKKEEDDDDLHRQLGPLLYA